MPKKIVWAMLKKEEKRRKTKISMPKGMREKKMHAKEHEEKKEKEKKEIKIAHTFKIKIFIQKREIHDSRSTKNI